MIKYGIIKTSARGIEDDGCNQSSSCGIDLNCLLRIG